MNHPEPIIIDGARWWTDMRSCTGTSCKASNRCGDGGALPDMEGEGGGRAVVDIGMLAGPELLLPRDSGPVELICLPPPLRRLYCPLLLITGAPRPLQFGQASFLPPTRFCQAKTRLPAARLLFGWLPFACQSSRSKDEVQRDVESRCPQTRHFTSSPFRQRNLKQLLLQLQDRKSVV